MKPPKQDRESSNPSAEAQNRPGAEAFDSAPQTFSAKIWDPSGPKAPPSLTAFRPEAHPVPSELLKHIQAQGWMVFDILLGAAAMLGGFLFSPYYRRWDAIYLSSSYVLLAILVFATSLIISGLLIGLYEKTTALNRWRILMVSLFTSLLAVGMTALFFSLFMFQPIGRYILLISLSLSFSALTLPRLFFYQSLLLHKIKVVIVGYAREAVPIYHALKTETARPIYQIYALCLADPELDYLADPADPAVQEAQRRMLTLDPGNPPGLLPIFCSISNLKNVCEQLAIEKIIIGNIFSRSLNHFSPLMNCFPAGARIMSWSSFNEEFLQHVSLDCLTPEWLYSANMNVNNPILFAAKRVFDLVIASLGLLLSFPILLCLSPLIKLTSRGPVFYCQERTGRFGRPFRIFKLRTMVQDAENGEAQWADEDDERCTPIGSVLRRSRLDEIPQFWNILKGEMSLVGPRPERPELVEQLVRQIPFFDLRHLVNPGLTGWAQINYSYGASVRDAKNKLQFDLYYIKYLSLFLDFQIILRTFSNLMRGSR